MFHYHPNPQPNPAPSPKLIFTSLHFDKSLEGTQLSEVKSLYPQTCPSRVIPRGIFFPTRLDAVWQQKNKCTKIPRSGAWRAAWLNILCWAVKGPARLTSPGLTPISREYMKRMSPCARLSNGHTWFPYSQPFWQDLFIFLFLTTYS